jgi:hypothetical protein
MTKDANTPWNAVGAVFVRGAAGGLADANKARGCSSAVSLAGWPR